MMITIHGLPVTTKYQDLKVLIKQECNINDFILDCLVNDSDGTKKVRVGLADDSEGSHFIKCLNGYRMSGNILRLVPVGKSVPTNAPPQSSFDLRGNYQGRNEYPSQGFSERNRVVEAARPTPWANQWSSNQTMTQLPNNYNYQPHQQPINTYGQQTNSQLKPQFESREAVPPVRGAQMVAPYGYHPKTNLISLGPTRTVPSTLREIPETGRPMTSRYPTQNYDIQTEKPVTISKDNFQGPTQYNMAATHSQDSGNYQVHSQVSPWAPQQSQKQFDKQPVAFEKKPYDDRKYVQANPMKSAPHTSKSEDVYRSYDKSRQFSPQRRPYTRDIAAEHKISSSEREVHTNRIMPGRRSPGRRISPSSRQSYPDRRSPVRRISPARRSSPPARTMHSGRGITPPGRRISPPGRRISPPGRRISPPGRRISPPGKRTSPPGRRISPSSLHIPSMGRQSSPGRHVSPGRRMSPMTRRTSPGRRMSPSGRVVTSDRQMSPHNRRFSPSGRNIPPNRQMSPGRKVSPSRKISPPHRRMSPPTKTDEYPKREEYLRSRRISPPTHAPMERRIPSRPSPIREVPRGVTSHARQESPRRQGRYSPSQHHTDKSQDYKEDRRPGNLKNVRPAYEPQIQASNEAIYSGGYRHKREDVQYPGRQDWQDREKGFPPKNIIEDRRDNRLQKFDMQRGSEQQRPMEQELKRSRSRSSRSPRRDRSPLRDRYRRHSPSPRSPRRSWALEKRRSPEAREPPPPPMWPGQDVREDYSHPSRSNIHDRQVEKHIPVWETRDKKRDDYAPADNRREFEDQSRLRKEVDNKWKSFPQSKSQESSSRMVDDSHIKKEQKFVRKDFEVSRDYAREEDMRKSHSDRIDKGYQRQDREDIRYKSDLERKDNNPRKREEYSGRIEEKKKEILQKQQQLQKEIDEVYKRAVDFTKKAELYRKLEHKKESSYDSERHRNEDRDDEYERYAHPREDLRKDYNKYPSKSDDMKKPSENIEKSKFESDDGPSWQALSPTIKAKRNKAIEEITEKMLCKYGSSLPSDIKKRVQCELKWTLGRVMFDLFGDKDVSFIEMVVKFNARHSQKDEERIFEEVMSSLPSHYRNMKRLAPGDFDVPAKVPRRSPEPNVNKDQQPRTNEQLIADWNVNMMPLNVATNAGYFMNSPLMVPIPAQYQFLPTYQEIPQPLVEETKKDSYNLYLCKDDFQPILEHETEKLKEFMIQQLIKVTETSPGWAPDFTLSKPASSFRHEVVTRDERSKDWLLSLDFSDFKEFNVLVYTTEELWYERAAVWLPGHSRCRNVEPLAKLKLQNKRLEGVNIGKWKLIKKIVTEKGTRVYVDMPPSSARALEKHKMMLSYELQKVNVFLKAVAIDKEAFDAGLNEASVAGPPPPASSPMPALAPDPNIVKIGAKGNKPLSLVTARKIKDLIIYRLFKYHQLDGTSRTDFVKYGFCQPGFLGVLPENEESKKWLVALDLGKMNRQVLVVIGANENNTVYIKMNIVVPRDNYINTALVYERLRHSNRGVKGVNFSLWKNSKIVRDHGKATFEVEMDLESVETISQMNYQLDYVAAGHDVKNVTVGSVYSKHKLNELIAKYKAELSDTYDVANMELASSDTDSEVVCLD